LPVQVIFVKDTGTRARTD